ncbi:hypothetical protein NKJ35_29080 [Mesorhizobium sp. M0136]|uniref:hypothetical protein n=1 Tax=Mesorhizobium sp. M0136 TaxID=2956890 RepID=UPI0033359382
MQALWLSLAMAMTALERKARHRCKRTWPAALVLDIADLVAGQHARNIDGGSHENPD